jgi:hypothetical protein
MHYQNRLLKNGHLPPLRGIPLILHRQRVAASTEAGSASRSVKAGEPRKWDFVKLKLASRHS